MPDEVVEDFGPSNGRVTGVLGLAICLGIVILGVVERDEGFPPAAVWGALLGGVLFWSASLRPRVRVDSSQLRLRNMLTTITVPLAAIEQIVVRQVLLVRVGDQRYVSSAIGKSWRQALKSNRQPKPGEAAPYPIFVEERLQQLAEEARARAGITLMSDQQLALAHGVRRDLAWPEIVLLGFTALGLVVSLLV